MLIKNSILYGLTTVIKGGTSFLRIAVFTRMLSPADYGEFAVAVVLVTFVDAFAFQWIRQTVARHITHLPADDDLAYITNAFLLHGILSLVCFIGLPVLTGLGLIDIAGRSMAFNLIGLLIAAEAMSNFLIVMARVRLRRQTFFILNILQPLISLIAGILLIKAGYGAGGAITGFLLSLLVTCLVGLFRMKEFREISVKFVNKDIFVSSLSFGLPLAAVFFVQSSIGATDRLFLDALMGSEITGLYAAAQEIPSRILNLVALAVHLAAYPLAVSKLDHESVEACRKQLRQNYSLLLAVIAPCVAGLAVIAPAVANLLLGEPFRPFASDYLPYLVMISFMNYFIQYYFILSFNLAKKTKLLLLPFFITFCVNIVVTYFGIKTWGVEGVLIGSFMAYGTLISIIVLMSRKVFPMPVPILPTLQILSATIIMAACVKYMDAGDDILGLILSVVSGCVIYAAVLLSLNTANSRHLLLGILRGKGFPFPK